MSHRLDWTMDDTPGEVIVALRGDLLGGLPELLARTFMKLARRRIASADSVVDLTAIDRVDTPGVEALRAALAPLMRLRLRLPAEGTPAALLLRGGLAGCALAADAPDDRRRHRRFAARVGVRLALAGGEIHSGVTANVSCGGLLASLDGRPSRKGVHAAGERVRVELPALNIAWRAATVVDRGPRALRLAFDEPCPQLPD